MEAVEVLTAAPPPPPLPSGRHKDLSPIAKGKRTKRLRHYSPLPFTIATPSHNTTTGNDDHCHHLRRSTTMVSASSSSTSSSEESTTTEEVDTARCLILLSQGQLPSSPHDPPNNNNNPGHTTANHHHPSRQPSTTAIYTCKTCNRSFPSFQALGGHRASHKKPKNEKRAAAASMFSDEEDFPSPPTFRNRISLNSLSLQLGNNASTATFSPTLVNKSSPSPRMHECSYCGAEFTSGQALGGHMRKHRAGPIIRSPEEVGPMDSRKPEINFGLSLDLNLPAPEDEKEKIPKDSNQRFRPGLGHHYYTTID